MMNITNARMSIPFRMGPNHGSEAQKLNIQLSGSESAHVERAKLCENRHLSGPHGDMREAQVRQRHLRTAAAAWRRKPLGSIIAEWTMLGCISLLLAIVVLGPGAKAQDSVLSAGLTPTPPPLLAREPGRQVKYAAAVPATNSGE